MNKSYIGWDTQEHNDHFGFWNKLTNFEFNFRWGSFYENAILVDSIKNGESLLEVGCATGSTVKWLKNNKILSKIQYLGVDISNNAIIESKKIYPGVEFKKIELGKLEDFYNSFDFVFSRDTVLHQENPYEFLGELIKCTNKKLILRLRTREIGNTELDISKSCQLHYNKYWMPYIVLNIDELIKFLSKYDCIEKITINKNFEVLGGKVHRYLPKDLYFEEAGGSETAIIIDIDKHKNFRKKEVVIDNQIEGRDLIQKNILKRLISLVLNKLT